MSLKLGNTNIGKMYVGSAAINKIYKGTDLIWELIQRFRNIQVGDNLAGKDLYFSFPRNLYASMSDGTNNIFTTAASEHMYTEKSSSQAFVNYNDDSSAYNFDITGDMLYWNNTGAQGLNYGTVNAIYPSNPAYQYISILDDNRNLIVGDNLSNQTIYTNFPDSLATAIGSQPELTSYDIVQSSGGYYIRQVTGHNLGGVYVFHGEDYVEALYYYEYASTVNNLSSYTLPSDFGTITSISTYNASYQYITL